MRIISWNVRGMSSDVKVSAIRKLIRSFRIDMILIQETKKEVFDISEIHKLWFDDEFGFKFSASVGRSGGLLTI
ncbi:hypothetical protein GQ457_08G035770 [Hibiscus cannabinus]